MVADIHIRDRGDEDVRRDVKGTVGVVNGLGTEQIEFWIRGPLLSKRAN